MCHLLYTQTSARSDARNALQWWGLAVDKDYRYVSNNTFKLKEEAFLHVDVTSLFRGTAPMVEDPPVLAIVTHLDPATGKNKDRVESIQVSERMTVRLEICLNVQTSVEAWA